MKKTIKAVFLSIFALPGLGHLYLKHRKTGYGLIVATIAFSTIIIQQLMKTLNKILEDFMANNDLSQIDITKVREIAHQALEDNNFLAMQVGIYGLITCYIYAIITSYQIAKKQEAEEQDEA